MLIKTGTGGCLLVPTLNGKNAHMDVVTLGKYLRFVTLNTLNAAKNTHYIKKSFNESYSRLNFVQKIPLTHMSMFPREWSKRPQKTDTIEILYCIETANYIQFKAQCCQKYALHQKKFQMKVVQN